MPRCFPAAVSRAVGVALVSTALACADVTAPTSPASSTPRNAVALAAGDVYVVVQTDPDGAADQFTFTHSFGTSSSPQVTSPFVLRDGRLEVFNSVAPGTYTLSHLTRPEWDLVESGDGYETGCWDDQGNSSIDLSSGVATINVGSGEFIVCTFVFGKRATVVIDKRENGSLPLSTAWTFELRTGASPTSAGTVRAVGAASLTTGQVLFSCVEGSPGCGEADGATWLKAQNYQLCETGMPEGVTNSIAGFTPAGAVPEGGSGATDCVNVTLGRAQALTTVDVLGTENVNNVVPAAEPPETETPPRLAAPRGSGFWKHSGACHGSGGHGHLSGDIYPLGAITALTCVQAGYVLGKADLSGDAHANDAGYHLAAQLLAARLNRLDGAPVPACVYEAMSAAQGLLAGIGFAATGDYLPPRGPHKATRNAALELAEVLGRYNDGHPAVLAGSCG